ncbi:MAG: toprim domain-containing protein [Patescibacteria group bacterium]
MSPIRDLTELLSKLPGLGPRQARRVVQYLLSRDQAFRERLAADITSLNQKAAQCPRCMRYDDPTQSGLCYTCSDTSRDATTLLVVEHDVDIDAIEASLTYKGLYFVLGGLMNLVRERKDKVIRVAELLKRVDSHVTEVIFALSTTPEGDYTAKELSSQLTAHSSQLRVTHLGRGLSVGAELEYADPETLRSALRNRN